MHESGLQQLAPEFVFSSEMAPHILDTLHTHASFHDVEEYKCANVAHCQAAEVSERETRGIGV